MPLNLFHLSTYVVLDPWWVCLLSNHFSYLTFQKALGTPFAVGITWRAFCSSLWVGDLCYIRRCPKLLCYSDNYYLAFPKDPSTTKIVVYAVYAVELTQMILFSIMVFKEFVTGFGNLVTLPEMGDFWFAVPILSSTGMFPWPLSSTCLQVN